MTMKGNNVLTISYKENSQECLQHVKEEGLVLASEVGSRAHKYVVFHFLTRKGYIFLAKMKVM